MGKTWEIFNQKNIYIWTDSDTTSCWLCCLNLLESLYFGIERKIMLARNLHSNENLQNTFFFFQISNTSYILIQSKYQRKQEYFLSGKTEKVSFDRHSSQVEQILLIISNQSEPSLMITVKVKNIKNLVFMSCQVIYLVLIWTNMSNIFHWTKPWNLLHAWMNEEQNESIIEKFRDWCGILETIFKYPNSVSEKIKTVAKS